MLASQSQGGITNSYQLDATGRVRQVVQTGSKEGTEVFHYAGSSDSPVWTERGSAWTRNIGGIGGGLAAIQTSTGETSLQLAGLHGDIVATASLSTTAKEPTAKFEFDEFGNPKSGSAGRFGWLGGKQRRTELPSGVIQMGVRSYVPALGRFITPDPIAGGSANAYDYANQDPVNHFDLTGENDCAKHPHPPCAPKYFKKAAHKANKRHAIVVKFNTRRGAERFLHSLESASQFLHRIQGEANKWHAQQIKEMQERAEKAAGAAHPVVDENAHACGWIAYGAGAVATGLALAPVSGGTSFIVGLFSVATGTGAMTGEC